MNVGDEVMYNLGTMSGGLQENRNKKAIVLREVDTGTPVRRVDIQFEDGRIDRGISIGQLVPWAPRE